MAVPKLFKGKEKEVKKDKASTAPDLARESAESPKQKTKSSLGGLVVLKQPHVTEKAVMLAESGQYVFQVMPRATKKQVQEAIHNLYNVDVKRVRMIVMPAKANRFGRYQGYKSGYKKAIVQLKKGQKIEVIPT